MSILLDETAYVGMVVAAAVVFVLFGLCFALGYWVAS